MSLEVCIVDDEAGITEMCKDYLADAYSVKVFSSPEEAVAAFDSDYRPDVLLTDIKMPGMDGFQMAQRIHERAPELPVVMMSGYADKGHLLKAIENEAQGFIEKPFSPKKMKSTIESVVKKSTHAHGLETLVHKYEELTLAATELNTRYVERYARAENKLESLNVPLQSSPIEVKEFLDAVKEENRLDRLVNHLRAEIEQLRGPSKLSRA